MDKQQQTKHKLYLNTDKQQQQIKHKLLKKLVSNARAIITYEVGLSVGCYKMSRLMAWLEPFDIAVKKHVFENYNKAILAIPSGKERLHCSREALRRYDSQLYPINMNNHNQIIDACFEIINSFGEVIDNPQIEQIK